MGVAVGAAVGGVSNIKINLMLVSYPDPTHSNEEKGLEQFLGFAELA